MLIDSVEYKIASNTEEIKKAYELVYENYIEKKFCNLNYHKMRIFLFDSLETTRTLIAKSGDTVLATTTLVFDSPIGLPSESIYKDRLDELRGQGKKICEISKLSTRKDLGSKSLTVLPFLFRTCWLYAKEIFPHSLFCIMVEPQNEFFYRKYYYFENNSDVRLDHKANEASSVLLEMPIDIKLNPNDLKTARERKNYQIYFSSPDCEKIIEEIKQEEEKISKINLSLLAPRKNRTLALSGEEKKALEFKFFIIRYNLEQISKNALSQSYKGEYLEAAESYEKLMKTLPSWAFSKEKDKIYENLCDFFFTTGAYHKQIEMAQKLQNSRNNSASFQGRNLKGLGFYALGKIKECFKILSEAEELERENKDFIRLSFNLQFKAMILNHLSKHEEALKSVNEAILVAENEIIFIERTYLYLTAYYINEHLGKIKECKKIFQKFLAEIKLEDDLNTKVQINYYTCLSRYYRVSLQHQKAVQAIETILLKLGKKEEMPRNYAIHLVNYSDYLVELGFIRKALTIIDEALELKSYYNSFDFSNFQIKRLRILLLLDDIIEYQKCQNHIVQELRKFNETSINKMNYQNVLTLQLYLNKKPKDILKQKLNTIRWNKPQLSAELDFTTIYLLAGDQKKAQQTLKSILLPIELELENSDIDNKNLILIYSNLVNNSLETLISDLDNLFALKIHKEEVLSKCLILFNIIQIIDLYNKKKPQQNFNFIRNHLKDKFTFIVESNDIPIFRGNFQI